MSWEKIYQSRVMDADRAMEKIKTGDRITIPFAAGQPKTIAEALAKRIQELEYVDIAQMVTITRDIPYLAENIIDKVRFFTSYVGAVTRDHVADGTGQFIPCFLKDFPRMYSEEFAPTVAFIHVSPPDKHGYVSLGTSVDHNKASAAFAKTVIAEVNPQMPRTLGDSFLHVSEIDCFVESDHPILEIPRPKITEVEEKIGSYTAELIKNGDCLQLGIGAIPDALLSCLKDKRGLGIHTEMFSDGVVDLYNAGVIDNSQKTLHRGKMVTTFLMGTRALYDFVDDNPAVMACPGDYTNDPYIIAKNDNMVSVNSSVEIDLMGQAASESIGTRQYSGIGGQVDFIRGALASKNGRAVLALPSTAGKGENRVSKIVPQLKPGTPVTTSRNDIDYVVTEYGIAHLRYRSLAERAEQLINIAHPDYRDELRKAYLKFNW